MIPPIPKNYVPLAKPPVPQKKLLVIRLPVPTGTLPVMKLPVLEKKLSAIKPPVLEKKCPAQKYKTFSVREETSSKCLMFPFMRCIVLWELPWAVSKRIDN